jgi:hypothetical protein
MENILNVTLFIKVPHTQERLSFSTFMTLADGTDNLSRNVGKEVLQPCIISPHSLTYSLHIGESLKFESTRYGSIRMTSELQWNASTTAVAVI